MFDQKFIDRFNLKWEVDLATECWVWTASTAGRGYGQIKLPRERRQAYAHRVAYQIHKGEIPEGRMVLHSCDNPLCVNPDHLWLGDAGANAQDMLSKGRHLYGEKNTEAVLTADAVRKIKQLLDSGLPQKKIAGMYGIGQMQISRIKRGIRWRHID